MILLNRGPIRKVAFVSSYKPRRCGIATFAADLVKSLKLAQDGCFEPVIVALESGTSEQYDNTVKLRIRKDVRADYVRAADYINFSDVDIVSLQHEYGLFGGEAGSYLSIFLKRVNKPVVTTLHTILGKPSNAYFKSLIEVCQASYKLVVMNKRGVWMLRDVYGVPQHKIMLIPHGMPDLPFGDGDYYKSKLGFSGRRSILTFGLLSRNKGVEVMLRALPRVVQEDPSILYIVLGATHPEVLRVEGQSYTVELERTVAQLGMERNVVFHNRFVADSELFDFLCAADIYVTPYLRKEQLTSGTLAFAVGAGKAVVSTPYWAAKELLAQGRGKLVRFGDSNGLARTIIALLRDESELISVRQRAYEYGRSRTWLNVGRSYTLLFGSAANSVRLPLKKAAGLDLPGVAYKRLSASQSA